jgi:pyruvate ferredoxin oxidoreductase beta subunit
MNELSVYAARAVPKREYFLAGHKGCTGCIPALTVRLVMKALGPNTIVSNATGCLEIISSSWPDSSWGVPWMHVAFETAASVAAGMEAGQKAILRKKTIKGAKEATIVAFAGDGGTGDIGLQALSGAMERRHNMIYVCYDNEAYMNTGVQRSGMTPFGAWTTTSPPGVSSQGQYTWKKDLSGIIAAHHIPYLATACPSYPFDLINKVKKAKSINGPTFLHILSPCPTGWRTDPSIGISLGRMAVESGVFPLYEVINGQYVLNHDPKEFLPLTEYLKPQRRFRHLTEETVAHIQEEVLNRFADLRAKAKR